MGNKHKPYGIYEKYFKRLIDCICGIMVAFLFCWLFALIAILVKVKIGTPVIFCQERPGKDEKIFKLYKFRTMTNVTDEKGDLLSDEKRMTRFGSALRKTSLDELPEIWNIIKGDMSIIGPRPLLVKYLDRYNEFQHRRHEVRPGLSGYAQVNGRNAISWEEKFKLDVEYVDKITFVNDFKIIVQTIKCALIKQEGISSNTSVTMEEFLGNDE